MTTKADLRIKELEEKNRLLETSNRTLEKKIQEKGLALNKTTYELESATEALTNLQSKHEIEINNLNKQKIKLEQDFNLKILEIEELNKNLETRTSTLKRTESNLKQLTEQLNSNPERIAQLESTTKELTLELSRTYSYLQKVVSKRSLLLKSPIKLSDYHLRLEAVFTDLEKNARSVHLQLLSLLEFKRDQDQVTKELRLVQEQIYTDTDSVTRLSMTMTMPPVPGTTRDNYAIALQRDALIKNIKELKETRRDLLTRSNTNTKLEEEQVMNVTNYFQELINHLRHDVKDLHKYLTSLEELKKDVQKHDVVKEEISPIRKSIDKEFFDNFKRSMPTLKEVPKQSQPNPNSNSNGSPDRSADLHSPTELPKQTRKNLIPIQVNNKKPLASQTSIDTEAPHILDDFTQSTPTSVSTSPIRQRTVTGSAENHGMVNTTHSVTPNVTTLSQQVSEEIPIIIEFPHLYNMLSLLLHYTLLGNGWSF
jgi:ribosomal protein S15P/S13E